MEAVLEPRRGLMADACRVERGCVAHFQRSNANPSFSRADERGDSEMQLLPAITLPRCSLGRRFERAGGFMFCRSLLFGPHATNGRPLSNRPKSDDLQAIEESPRSQQSSAARPRIAEMSFRAVIGSIRGVKNGKVHHLTALSSRGNLIPGRLAGRPGRLPNPGFRAHGGVAAQERPTAWGLNGQIRGPQRLGSGP
jgi:hypothetical protein